MQKVNENHLSLFLHQEEPLIVYVVNNKLLRFHEYGGYDRSFTKAFYFLSLMNKEAKIDFIPSKLRNYFKEDTKIHSILSYPLIGESDYSILNLDCELKIEPNKEFPIILHDIKHHKTLQKDQISLSAQDAFFLFANICTNARCDWFRKVLRREGKLQLDKPLLEKNVRKEIKRENISEDRRIVILNAYLFMLDYLEYLREQLLKKKISLKYILNLSGARLLAFLAEFEPELIPILSMLDNLSNQKNLQINEKTIYYTLFEIYNFNINFWRKDSDLAKNFNQLLSEKHSFLRSIRNDIRLELKKINSK